MYILFYAIERSSFRNADRHARRTSTSRIVFTGSMTALSNSRFQNSASNVPKPIICSHLVVNSRLMTQVLNTDAQAEELRAQVQAKLPDTVELALINGGQPVYYYMLSVE